MSIVHGNWIAEVDDNYFFVWGETWRSLVNVNSPDNDHQIASHPFCLEYSDLLAVLREVKLVTAKDLVKPFSSQNKTINIPSIRPTKKEISPIFSQNVSNLEIDSKQKIVYHDCQILELLCSFFWSIPGRNLPLIIRSELQR